MPGTAVNDVLVLPRLPTHAPPRRDPVPHSTRLDHRTVRLRG